MPNVTIRVSAAGRGQTVNEAVGMMGNSLQSMGIAYATPVSVPVPIPADFKHSNKTRELRLLKEFSEEHKLSMSLGDILSFWSRFDSK